MSFSHKVYIATRLDQAKRHQILSRALEDRGYEITYDWTKHGSVQSEGMDRISEVAKAELQGVREADSVIALLPGGRGTHTELGAALALGKQVIVWGEDEQAFIQDGYKCCFYLLATMIRSPFHVENTMGFPTVIEALRRYSPDETVKHAKAFDTLRSFADLEEGWDGYGAQTILPEAVSSAAAMLGWIFRDIPDCPEPHVTPVPNGCVNIEWNGNGTGLEIELGHPEGWHILTMCKGGEMTEGFVEPWSPVVLWWVQWVTGMEA